MKEMFYKQLPLPNFPKPPDRPNRLIEAIKLMGLCTAGYAAILFGTTYLLTGFQSMTKLDKNGEFLLSMTAALGIPLSLGLALTLENPKQTISVARNFLNRRFYR